MKLKLYITAFLIIFQIYHSFGQDFAPIGAKWYYTEQFAFSGDISYLWIESVGDTIIKGKDCKILENNGGLMCAFHNTKDFVYFEDSIAYFYVPEIDTFQILYDLKAQKDSSWTIVFGMDLESKLDTIQVVVDSVSFMTINSKKLKKLHVSYKSLNFGWEDLGYGGEIIERIGDKNYLFNLYSLSGIVCDGNYSGGLRCYQDSELGFYSTGIADSCDYTYKWTGIESNSINAHIKVYPNPASDWIEIESKTNKELMISILDLSGKVLVNSKSFGSSRIDLTSFQKGFYVLKINQSDKIIETRKILKK
ncbi:MAG: T9SS type A sorting domain-containing protein [Chloroflexia bacterium]|nr:T9SS type A sorting domain-containing protein [Chloroflexia bacterium]